MSSKILQVKPMAMDIIGVVLVHTVWLSRVVMVPRVLQLYGKQSSKSVFRLNHGVMLELTHLC